MATFGKVLIIFATFILVANGFDRDESSKKRSLNIPHGHDLVNIGDIFPIRKLYVPIQKRIDDRPREIFILAALFDQNHIGARSATMDGVRIESATKDDAYVVAAPNSGYTGSFHVTFTD